MWVQKSNLRLSRADGSDISKRAQAKVFNEIDWSKRWGLRLSRTLIPQNIVSVSITNHRPVATFQRYSGIAFYYRRQQSNDKRNRPGQKKRRAVLRVASPSCIRICGNQVGDKGYTQKNLTSLMARSSVGVCASVGVSEKLQLRRTAWRVSASQNFLQLVETTAGLPVVITQTLPRPMVLPVTYTNLGPSGVTYAAVDPKCHGHVNKISLFYFVSDHDSPNLISMPILM
ncbi:hypothetical protein EDD85DRAFT_793452 [Armillaria nabsnona]|nr:hypothetical protein EDD85DRAFT_793452 [Armillaria nabsnona]